MWLLDAATRIVPITRTTGAAAAVGVGVGVAVAEGEADGVELAPVAPLEPPHAARSSVEHAAIVAARPKLFRDVIRQASSANRVLLIVIEDRYSRVRR